MERKTGWKTAGLWSTWLSLVPLCLGFYKMFVYESSEYSWSDPKNVYVGGDAYNYIINANYATAYFVLFGILLIVGVGCGILYYLSGLPSNASINDKADEHKSEDEVKNTECVETPVI